MNDDPTLFEVWAAIYLVMVLGLCSGVLLAYLGDHVHLVVR